MNHVLPSTVDHPLYALTLALIERLLMSIDDDTLAAAPLTERLTALDVLCRILNQIETTSSANSSLNEKSEQEVVRVEQQDSQARRGESPPRTDTDSEHARPVPGGCVWAAFRQD